MRFTFGVRLDTFALDIMEDIVEARFSPEPPVKIAALTRLLLRVEKKRVLWRLAHSRAWIGARQLLHIASQLDEAARMATAWRKSLLARLGPP